MKSCILLVVSVFIVSLIYANQLQVVTEEFPPFNYTENGKITGFSTEVVEAILKEAGIEGKPRSYPWARSYKKALNEKNYILSFNFLFLYSLCLYYV